MREAGRPPWAVKAAEYGLRGLWLFTLVTLVGYATFGVNPGLLARFPQVAWIYGPAFRFFAVGHVWLAFAAIAVFLVVHTGTRWLPAFLAAYVISLGAELMGTRYGIPFGGYDYTTLMNPMWFDRVPIVIPLSWFYMAIPAYALARAALPGDGRVVGRIVLGSLALVAWDLSLDPAMSYATPYWIWEVAGPYYGMPWVNLAGWFLTGLFLMGAQHLLGADRWLASVPLGWLGSFYLVNLVLPLGMNAAAGLWWAVALTLLVVGTGWMLFRARLRESGFSLAGTIVWRAPHAGGVG